MTRRTILTVATVALALLTAVSVAACGETEASAGASPSSTGSPSGDVSVALATDDRVSRYAEAFAAAEISGEGPFTVFAASDDAVAASGVVLDGDFVRVSIIQGEDFAREDLALGTKADSMLEDNGLVTYTGVDGSLYVNDIRVIGEAQAGNGTVYVIDGVLQPKE